MNNKFTFELDWETMDKIAIAAMKDTFESLKTDLEKRKNGEEWMAIFDHDREKDIAEIEQHVNAFKIVLGYFGEKED